MIIKLLLLNIIMIVALLIYYRPTIDVVLSNNRYKIILWYNKRKWDNQEETMIVKRNYIHLITL